MNAALITSILRHLLGIAGGYLLAKGIELDATSIETISGALGSLIAVVWSLYSKRQPTPLKAD